MLEQTWLYESFRLLRWTQNLCCSEHIATYGCQLWCSMYQYSFNKLRVAYIDVFRQLLQEPRWCSASKLFVFNSVSSLPENMQKLIFSLWRSLQISDNSLVNAVFHRTCFLNLQFLSVGEVVCFSLFFTLCVCVCVLCVHGPRACYWRQINK